MKVSFGVVCSDHVSILYFHKHTESRLLQLVVIGGGVRMPSPQAIPISEIVGHNFLFLESLSLVKFYFL